MSDSTKTTVIVQKPAEPAAGLVASLDVVLSQRVEQGWDLESYALTGDDTVQQRKRLALRGFAMRGIISEGCRMVGCSRTRWYEWIKEDEEFARAALDGKEFAMETLEAMAFSRGYVISDALLQFMLKHGKPQTFKDRVEHSGPNGVPLQSGVQVNISPVLILPDNHRQDPPNVDAIEPIRTVESSVVESGPLDQSGVLGDSVVDG